ncbi:MAG: M14 family metallopeptidase [Bacteroidetes bacterium]|nr:M14 family metallopeptidase [Bacteroidota bacterium]
MTQFLISLFLSVLVAYSASAQLLSPAEFLGYELGEQFTPHHRVNDYALHVAESSSNVMRVEYGHTYQGRVLQYLIISSDENMSRLEEIRTANLHRAQLADGSASDDPPVAIVWLSYNVHGNESVGTEVALKVLYTLASEKNQQISEWLANTVVIIDPCLNPDGRDRYINFYRQTRGRKQNVLPEAREHSEPWPGGRTNHYYFDLNRDWAWGTQIETRQRLPHYNRWMPHIHVDFHEQGVNSPYFFPPAAIPFHKYITSWQRDLQKLIGTNHAKYFDAEGWLFFTRQVFDLFYPGYGDTWPMFNGALGMTYEQGGSGRAGLGILTAEGDTLTLKDRIDHHYTTSLSTIEVAHIHKDQIISEFTKFFQDASEVPTGNHTTYMVRYHGQHDQVKILSEHLDLLGIQYGYAIEPSTQTGFSYQTRRRQPIEVFQGDLIIPAAQPKGVLASVLFEPEPELEDSLTYDITAWALPYVYGVDSYAFDSQIDWGQKIPTKQGFDQVNNPVAFIAEWKSFEDARFLADLLRSGVKARYTEIPIKINDRSYNEGALIMTREQRGADFDSLVFQSARRTRQQVDALSTTFVTEGVDFGSGDVVYIHPPRIAIVSGPSINSNALGQLWHFFDEQLEYPATLIDQDDFKNLHLYRFDVIILPSGNYEDILSQSRLDDIQDWIREGGRLIAIERATAFLAGKDGFKLDAKSKSDEKSDSLETETIFYAQRARHAISEDIPGAIFRVIIDTTHPLAFGYQDSYYALKVRSQSFEMLKDGWNVGVLTNAEPVAGFAGAETLASLENSLVFGVESMGQGEVIYFMDNPVYRGFYYQGRLLLSNAVFFAGQRSVASY